MHDKRIVQSLLLETHRCVDQASREAVAKIGRHRRRPPPRDGEIDTEVILTYPPNSVLTPEEETALRSMKLSTIERSALQKLIADGCAGAFFDFFNLIDGTGDPEVRPPSGTWLGARLAMPDDNRDREVLHDGFFESYEEYVASVRSNGSDEPP